MSAGLVVDDDRSTRPALLRLEHDGSAWTSSRRCAALALVDSLRPDVIIMDALMPNMDGFSDCVKLQISQ